jgi:hypothetical protein
MREVEDGSEVDADDEREEESLNRPSSSGFESNRRLSKSTLKSLSFKVSEESVNHSVLLDWGSEGPYDEAVKG